MSTVWLRPKGNHFHAHDEVSVDVKVDGQTLDLNDWNCVVLDGEGHELPVDAADSLIVFVPEKDGLYTVVAHQRDSNVAGKIVLVVGHDFEPNMAQAGLPVEVFPLRLGYFTVGSDAEFIILKDKEPYSNGILHAVHEDGTSAVFELAEDGTVVLTINQAGDWLFTAILKDELDDTVYSCSYTIPGVTEEEMHLHDH